MTVHQCFAMKFSRQTRFGNVLLAGTVIREIFVLRIIRVYNVRVKKFCSLH